MEIIKLVGIAMVVNPGKWNDASKSTQIFTNTLLDDVQNKLIIFTYY